jgi:D-tyrosyl-tRNA(Tyr) deacylase
MRTVIQRVKQASVSIEGKIISNIGKGLVIFIGIEDRDTKEDIEWLAKKIINLRVFDDNKGVMNYSVTEIDGEIMVVSQFTLQASVKKGNRPSYIKASKPLTAIPLYKYFCQKTAYELGKKIASGIFGSYMQIELINDGPVTIWIDSQNRE